MQKLKEIDKSDMLDLLLDFPGQCTAAVEIAKNAGLKFSRKDFKAVAFAGLGGSAIGADLVRAYLYSESKIPIQVFREYDLPAFLDSSTLLFIISYSGNTEETLSAYEQAKKKNCTIIVISSNGKLKEKALRDGVSFIEIPGNLPPRCSLGYLSLIPLSILARLGMIKDPTLSINQTVRILEELRDKNLNPRIEKKDNIAKSAAKNLYKKFAVIYSASLHFDVCATRLRGQLAENAKALSSSHYFPEMNHNEIVGWQNPGKLLKDFIVVMLKDKEMHQRVVKRMTITSEILSKEGVKLIEIHSRGESLLSRMFSLIYIGDFISFYLASLYGIDPTPVERIIYLKKRLAEG
ncbi:MAG: bifunctional phosphoglucose/phosphomannose isomerase [Candidatus Omnitrophica bacterium]|nr:bifunctional phosphoglucose/phosphomannose isomerase [Candidatus Omnitrophota bacterium]